MSPTADPAARDFAIECVVADWEAGRADAGEIDRLRDALRAIGDVVRLERVARRIASRH